MIKVTYDKSVDAAKIYLKHIEPGGVAKVYTCDEDEVGEMINLDFDAEGVLLAIEVLRASKKLPAALLKIAD
jgi:uncharacterized protein YuzE